MGPVPVVPETLSENSPDFATGVDARVRHPPWPVSLFLGEHVRPSHFQRTKGVALASLGLAEQSDQFHLAAGAPTGRRLDRTATLTSPCIRTLNLPQPSGVGAPSMGHVPCVGPLSFDVGSMAHRSLAHEPSNPRGWKGSQTCLVSIGGRGLYDRVLFFVLVDEVMMGL